MGEQRVSILSDEVQMQQFVRRLLNDVKALKYMLDNDWFESGITRIGAEQEMCLVDNNSFKPAPKAMEALDKMTEYPWVETELAKFNLEINLDPRVFNGTCLSELEEETSSKLKIIQDNLDGLNTSYILTGILPTLKKFHLDMNNLTPKKRYKALMEAINEQHLGSAFELKLIGIDELLVKHHTPLLEACNTSFQVHLQIDPKNFVKMYNISQMLAAPVMAIAANSPIVFGRRLWHETRIAMFQQSLDTRSTHEHMRQRSPRVIFGNDWLHDSILEIYREDIARFRVLIAGDIEEDSLELIEKGEVPKLRALQVHNSTVYRWNRPCFGISDNGKPHLRIENRVLPSGPTVEDEIANTAFWLGLMTHFDNEYNDIRDLISFSDIKDNFSKAAKFGIDTKFNWFDDRKISVVELILEELIPQSRAGLQSRNIDEDDINRYLGLIESRAKNHMTGARWALRAFTKLKEEVSIDEALTLITSSTIANQQKGIPIHEWPMPDLKDLVKYEPGRLLVDEFMETDLFTVQKEDIIELVAEMMDWRKIRYTPVEDAKGNLVGLVSSRLILRHFIKKNSLSSKRATTVEDIMITNPVTISPSATLSEAAATMRKNKIGCLPVIEKGALVGIITEMDFLRISSRLIERIDSN